jgi:hypothetical protein
MKYLTGILLVFVFQTGWSQIAFDDHFTRQSLRIDFLLAGSSAREEVYLQDLKKESPWAGPLDKLISPFDYGNYRVVVKDSSMRRMLYTRGFSSLFEEWQTTDEAADASRAFRQTIRVPFPRHKVWVQIIKRGGGKVLWQKLISPHNYFIADEKPPKAEVSRIIGEGNPSRSVDIVFIAEGYRSSEMEKFEEDVRKTAGYILSQKPFEDYRQHFNVYAVKAVSMESGTDIPGDHVYKNTALNTRYYTFDLPRYLTTFDTWGIRDYAANAPYDHIFLLINTNRYGGGGFYNHYSATTAGHYYSRQVAIHELGHGFAGLGDEYYNASVAYNEFYPLSEEPWEPNLTTLVNFRDKWKSMVEEGTPVPTPRADKYEGKVGIFEGGGYAAKGIYSPSMDCRMKSNEADRFCPVCQKAIEEMILYYTAQTATVR